ncbi:hypothetical protein MNV49_001238 [Pseudohyphozyma bogoriensis]|nr:hypothetical protein MNV49_001238 [Pseudohyphozyma bogoriensis]
MSQSTAFCWHSSFAWNDVGGGPFGHADGTRGIAPIAGVADPETKRRTYELIETSGLLKQLQRVDPEPATDEDVLRFHHKEYVEEIKIGSQQCAGFDLSDGTTHIGKGGYEMALLAVGGAIKMVQEVCEGRAKNGYESGMGFCLINNVAITAEAAIAKFGVKKVAIVDIDVHHGNGTEKGFYERNDVLTISIHQDRNYPNDTGSSSDTGAGAGKGYNFNIPHPIGVGNHAYEYTFDTLVVPALRQFKPDLILVASGVDASVMDIMARQMVSAKGFRMIARKLKEVAEEVCDGKLVFLQEGGYSPYYAPFCVLAMIEELAEAEPYEDAYAFLWQNMHGVHSTMESYQKAAIDALLPNLEAIL